MFEKVSRSLSMILVHGQAVFFFFLGGYRRHGTHTHTKKISVHKFTTLAMCIRGTRESGLREHEILLFLSVNLEYQQTLLIFLVTIAAPS